ncbi:MAG: OmpA family protein [bacterium]
MRWLIVRLFASLCALAAALPALAQPGPSIWEYSVKNQLKPGQQAELTLTPKVEVQAAHLSLESPTGGRQSFTLGRLPAGKSRTIKWKVPPGLSEWQGDLIGTVKGSTVNMTVTLKVISAEPLEVDVPKDQIDVSQGKLVLKSRSPLDRVEIQAFTVKGEQVVDTSIDLGGRSGSVPVEFHAPSDETIRRIELKVHDQVGYWMSVRLVDFYVEIPHEQVQFATAAFDVPIDEATKLDMVVLQVQDEINRFRDELGDKRARVDAALYVAGFTDTVGSKGDNERLSLRRAESIARYFWSNGIGVPIFYAGFGEDGLAVPTADEVDEAKNRRTLYILTNTRPRIEMHGRSWKQLR